jgi:hypothetical protein
MSRITLIIIMALMQEGLSFGVPDFAVLSAFTNRFGESTRIEKKLFPERTIVFEFRRLNATKEVVEVFEIQNNVRLHLFTASKVSSSDRQEATLQLAKADAKQTTFILDAVIAAVTRPHGN